MATGRGAAALILSVIAMGVTRSFEGTARNGTLEIGFKPSRGRAVVSVLAIAPIEQR